MNFFRRSPKKFVSPLDPAARVQAAYFVCTTHRSGSTMFCEGLAEAELGSPNEYFEDTLQGIWKEKWSLPDSADAPAYLREMVARQTSPGGIFAAKLMSHQTGVLRGQLQSLLAPDQPRASLPKLLAMAFPEVHYFWLRRSDTVAQAVSLARAQQTGRWHSVDQRGWVGVAPVAKVEKFDFAQIDSIHKNLLAWDARWKKFFTKPGLHVQTLVYEEFSPRYAETLREALAFLGDPESAARAIPAPRYEKLADATSQSWAEQYRAMKAAIP